MSTIYSEPREGSGEKKVSLQHVENIMYYVSCYFKETHRQMHVSILCKNIQCCDSFANVIVAHRLHFIRARIWKKECIQKHSQV